MPAVAEDCTPARKGFADSSICSCTASATTGKGLPACEAKKESVHSTSYDLRHECDAALAVLSREVGYSLGRPCNGYPITLPRLCHNKPWTNAVQVCSLVDADI